MLLVISQILSPEECRRISEAAAALEWRDGRQTAGKTAALVKQNLQANLSTSAGQALKTELSAAIKRHPVFEAAARPARMSSLLISKTTNGGHYGPHLDNALMASGEQRLRTDLSFTLALTAPESYEGGELVIQMPGTTERVKPAAGDLVLYPSTAIHEVIPVTSGERIVCVGWIQSLVRDQAAREILFDLENLRSTLRGSLSRTSPELLTLDKSIANLIRLFASP